MRNKKNETIKQMVKEKYASLSDPSAGCCNMNSCTSVTEMGKKLDYSENDLSNAMQAQMPVLGCGNPVEEAALKSGETVVDLGCGAGFDAFLSAKKVTENGRVIGVDMTPEMIDKAKTNSKNIKAVNVEFRLGEIENLPVENSTADIVMSNCVINLSPDKSAVYREIYRILKHNGRISISDVLKSGELSKEIMNDPAAYTGWVSGAISPDEVRQILEETGFIDITITKKDNSEEIIKGWNVASGAENVVFSAYIKARKPAKS